LSIKNTSRLHNRQTKWDDYRIKIEEAINLNITLKSPEELDIALTKSISILKEAAQKATQTPQTHARSNNIPFEI
jgi:hypothetical protein